MKTGKLRRLVRSYPQATAGIPRELDFDARTGDFRYTWTPRTEQGLSGAARTTVVFVSPLHYDGTPRVRVDNGVVVGDRDARRLRVRATGERPVTVRIAD